MKKTNRITYEYLLRNNYFPQILDPKGRTINKKKLEKLRRAFVRFIRKAVGQGDFNIKPKRPSLEDISFRFRGPTPIVPPYHQMLGGV